MHSTRNLNDGYIGSGVFLRNSVRKHGIETHICVIVEFCDDREALAKREAEIITEELLKDPLCMNLNLGGMGSWAILNKAKTQEERFMLGKIGGFTKLTAEQRRAAGRIGGTKAMTHLWLTSRDSMAQHLANAQLAAAGEESISKRIATFADIKHQQGESNSQFGTVWIHSLELKLSKKIKRDDLQSLLSDGWLVGRKMKF